MYSARAKVREAELNLGYATIRSPLNGSASRALQREGAYVGAAADTAKLTNVAALDPMWVTFSVSQNQLAKFQDQIARKLVVAPANNQFEVEIELPGGKKYAHKGMINFADSSFSQTTGSFMVRASLPNKEMELRPGMFVTARLLGAQHPEAIVVPQLAVQQGANGHAVLVVDGNGMAAARPVVVGHFEGTQDVIIEQGLKAGDQVIVSGFARVVPGAPVKVVATPAPTASTPAAAPAAGR